MNSLRCNGVFSALSFRRIRPESGKELCTCTKDKVKQRLKQGGEGCPLVTGSSFGGLTGLSVSPVPTFKHAVFGMTKRAAMTCAAQTRPVETAGKITHEDGRLIQVRLSFGEAEAALLLDDHSACQDFFLCR